MDKVYNASLKIQELKKLKDQNMIEVVSMVDSKGEFFPMIAMKKDIELSPYLPGYIITKEGHFIPVVNGDTHMNVADKYLEKYFHHKRSPFVFYLDALAKAGAVMYIGGRLLEDGSVDMSQPDGFLLTKTDPIMLPKAMLEALERLEYSICEHGMKLNYTGNRKFESPFGTDFENGKNR